MARGRLMQRLYDLDTRKFQLDRYPRGLGLGAGRGPMPPWRAPWWAVGLMALLAALGGVFFGVVHTHNQLVAVLAAAVYVGLWAGLFAWIGTRSR